jgi:hypothetical protein
MPTTFHRGSLIVATITDSALLLFVAGLMAMFLFGSAVYRRSPRSASGSKPSANKAFGVAKSSPYWKILSIVAVLLLIYQAIVVILDTVALSKADTEKGESKSLSVTGFISAMLFFIFSIVLSYAYFCLKGVKLWFKGSITGLLVISTLSMLFHFITLFS